MRPQIEFNCDEKYLRATKIQHRLQPFFECLCVFRLCCVKWSMMKDDKNIHFSAPSLSVFYHGRLTIILVTFFIPLHSLPMSKIIIFLLLFILFCFFVSFFNLHKLLSTEHSLSNLFFNTWTIINLFFNRVDKSLKDDEV